MAASKIFYPLCSGLLICLYVGLGPEKSLLSSSFSFSLRCSAQESVLLSFKGNSVSVLVFFLKFLFSFLDISHRLASSESHLPFVPALPSVVLHLGCWSF